MPADLSCVPAAPQAPSGPPTGTPASPGRGDQGPPFEAVLADHQARTASAEGRTGGDDTPKGTEIEGAATTAPEVAPDATAQALALNLTMTVPTTAPVAVEAPTGRASCRERGVDL